MNIILETDSYKFNHWNQYPKGTQSVYSYLEARKGAKFPETVFFGLQYIIKKYLLTPISYPDIMDARKIAEAHFGSDKMFNEKMWDRILTKHDGYLPLRIRAVPEGMSVPIGNVLMTIENTDDECFSLTNFVESLLLHVWAPTTVATLSRQVKKMLSEELEATSDNPGAINFMLHDFGYRGVSSSESAAICGAGHLINFLGTDTIPAIKLLHDYYGSEYKDIAYSVPATEHSVMTAEGVSGEQGVFNRLLDEYPTGILSIVSDSYNIERFIKSYVEEAKDKILARAGKLVIRPDSLRSSTDTPQDQVLWIHNELGKIFGYTENSKGYKVLNEKVGVLWGDGIEIDGIYEIASCLRLAEWSVESMVYGMGGGLLQKINRDTMRFAIKSSAQKRDGVWYPVSKSPMDAQKSSKSGKLFLHKDGRSFKTRTYSEEATLDSIENLQVLESKDVLQTVYENGKLVREYSLNEIRELL